MYSINQNKAKACQLVAWTDKGQVRMIPSLVSEMVQPYVETIEKLEKMSRNDEEEVLIILRLSRAYEALGDFFLRIGYWRDAFPQFVKAALTCVPSSDSCWLDCEDGYLLLRPLRNRFLSMHDRCLSMLKNRPSLQESIWREDLDKGFEKVTHMERTWSEELNAGLETIRAWSFGESGSLDSSSKVSDSQARIWRFPAYFCTVG